MHSHLKTHVYMKGEFFVSQKSSHHTAHECCRAHYQVTIGAMLRAECEPLPCQGAGIYLNNCVANNIRNTTFQSNQADNEGDAIFLNDSTPVGSSTCLTPQLCG